MSLLFMGVGNLHRADDGVGPLMAERLQAGGLLAKQGVEVMPHSGEGASLMHLWEGKRKVVVVDCMKTGEPVGTVRRFEAHKEKLFSGVFRYSSHLFGLAEATEVSRQLKKLPEELIIYGVEGREFAFGSPLSPDIEAVLSDLEAAVCRDFGGEADA